MEGVQTQRKTPGLLACRPLVSSNFSTLQLSNSPTFQLSYRLDPNMLCRARGPLPDHLANNRITGNTRPPTFRLKFVFFSSLGRNSIVFGVFRTDIKKRRFSTQPKIHKSDEEIEPVQMARSLVLKIDYFKRPPDQKCKI